MLEKASIYINYLSEKIEELKAMTASLSSNPTDIKYNSENIEVDGINDSQELSRISKQLKDLQELVNIYTRMIDNRSLKPNHGEKTVDLESFVSINLNNRIQNFFLIDGPTNIKAGLLSVDSLLGKALLGHKMGDKFSFSSPGGLVEILIESVLNYDKEEVIISDSKTSGMECLLEELLEEIETHYERLKNDRDFLNTNHDVVVESGDEDHINYRDRIRDNDITSANQLLSSAKKDLETLSRILKIRTGKVFVTETEKQIKSNKEDKQETSIKTSATEADTTTDPKIFTEVEEGAIVTLDFSDSRTASFLIVRDPVKLLIKRCITMSSPMGLAIMGKKLGEIIKLNDSLSVTITGFVDDIMSFDELGHKSR